MKIISHSVSQTIKIGKGIAKNLCAGDIVCLFGGLGSGKTSFTKGIACGLGIDQNEIISPTFVVMRQASAREDVPFYHFDFYRLRDCGDILCLGYEEYFYGSGITVIEWPDRLKYLLPEEYIKVALSAKGKDSRLIEITACGRRYEKQLRGIYENIRH